MWPPLGLELRFGFEDRSRSLPPLKLGRGAPDRVLVGLVDASTIDGAGHAVVRDYKSGRPRPGRQGARWQTDRQLQVALYMIVVRELSGRAGGRLLSAAARRRPARPRRVRGRDAPPGDGLVGTDGRTGEELDASCSGPPSARWRWRRRCARGSSSPARQLLARRLQVPRDLPCLISPEAARRDGARASTDEQLRAIERRRATCCSTPAPGSGKTSVLVERFVRSVLEDGVDVAAMLTITFTEKAAAEMRDRIRARLRELRRRRGGARTEGAFISTIHGFCARVLRANALAAGLDPAIRGARRARGRAAAAARSTTRWTSWRPVRPR